MRKIKAFFLSKFKVIKSDDRGAANLVSLVMLFPLMAALIFTMVDMSIYLMNRAQIQNLARDAARTVAIMGGNGRTPIAERYSMDVANACNPGNMGAPSMAAVGFRNLDNMSPIECNLAAALNRNGNLIQVRISSDLHIPRRVARNSATWAVPHPTNFSSLENQNAVRCGVLGVRPNAAHEDTGTRTSVDTFRQTGVFSPRRTTSALGNVSTLNRNDWNSTEIGQTAFCSVAWQYRGIPGSLLTAVGVNGPQTTTGVSYTEIGLPARNNPWS